MTKTTTPQKPIEKPVEKTAEKTAVTPAQKPESKTAVRVVTKDELATKLKDGSAQVVNVLEPDHYGLGSIKGSKKIPLSALAGRIAELDKSKEVVTYCAGPTCDASRKGAELLAAKGFNAGAYEGGVQEWKDAGLPLE